MADETIIYSMMRVSKKLPNGKTILKDISLSYFYGAKIGVLGLNGSGKSTLLRIMAGIDTDINGTAKLSDGYTVGYLAQEPEVSDGKTVKEVVEEGVQETVDLLKEFEEINAAFERDLSAEEMDKVMNRQAEVMDLLDSSNAWALEDRLNFAMEALRVPPSDQICSSLSGGEKRRVALCRLLLSEPDILLLDEPTNHLDAESVLWLEQYLRNYKGTVIAVTHDRYFLDNVAGWILELDRGVGVPWKGNYSSWLEQKSKRLESEEKSEEKRLKTLERELEWIRMSPKARHAKSKSRITAYEKLAGQTAESMSRDLQIFIPPGPRLGEVVVDAKDISKAYGEKLLFSGLDFRIPPGAVVGVIGPNGAGKSTLFRLILGQESVDSGSITLGETVKIASMDQSRYSLPEDKSVWEAVSNGLDSIAIGNTSVNSRAYVARFNFSGSDQQKPVSALSGGERNRLQMALMLKDESNLLLLDEPTNDLDVNTLRALEEAIERYAGSVIVTSHDRWFLDRLATHILAFEGDSEVRWFDGNFTEYEEDRIKRLGEEAKTPKRVRFARIKRD